jgi:nucleoside phosphorylase
MKAAQQRRTPRRERTMCLPFTATFWSAAVLCRFHPLIAQEQLPRQNHFMIAVTFALPAESREFLRSLTNKSRADRNGVRTVRGKIDNRTIEVFHTGVGKNVCRERVGKFLSATGRIRRGEQDQHFDYLISAGFAGALNDQLQFGDLLLAKNFSTVRLEENFSLSSFPIHVGDLLTVPALIDSREERNKLALMSGAVAVDMETEFIARACAAQEIPLLSLRVISDTPKDLFPAPANILFDIERQQTHILKLATHLLAHPHRIPRLVKFARRIARARKILASALITLVNKL